MFAAFPLSMPHALYDLFSRRKLIAVVLKENMLWDFPGI
jgi:hypothetical protein